MSGAVSRRSLLKAALPALVVLVSCSRRPDIPFERYGEDYRSRVDFARIEHRKPLRRADLGKLTPENLQKFTQEELDQIYARLTAGPVPDGAYEGSFFFADGGGLRRTREVLGGLLGVAADAQLTLFEHVGEALWKGKVFARKARILRNTVHEGLSLDLLLKALKVERNQLRVERVGGRDAYLLFPARIHCGQSLLDGRRESIVIDYAFTDELPGFQETIDSLGGRNGLQLREEIRLVRPGFYLGRAYLARVFALNFTLIDRDLERQQWQAFQDTGRIAEDCYVGTQRLTAYSQ